MESSNDLAFALLPPRLSCGSGLISPPMNFAPVIPPTPAKHESPSTETASSATGDSDTFVEKLHLKLISLRDLGEPKKAILFKRNHHRRSYRFSPYTRSRSLCSISTEPLGIVRRHASQSGFPNPSRTDKGLYAHKMSSTRGVSLLAKNSEHPVGTTNSDRGSDAISKQFMVRSASLRKAESLRKLAQTHFDKGEELIPTAPSTPLKFSQPDQIISSPTRIISPPPFIGPHVPLSTEAAAKMRLENYKEREDRTAEYDSLQLVDGSWSGSSEDWENLLGLGQRTRERRIDWLLRFLPKTQLHSVTSSFSSTSSTISSSSFSSFDQSMEGLVDQLKTSPETRFHAAWMFLRYHYLMGVVRTEATTRDRLPLYPSTGIWDVTLASLAISLKFHRDFLHPLLPVEAIDYIQISPHDMGYEDFEYAQRTMLNAFDYQLGVTPQPFLDQAWIALFSLRELLDFDGGWNEVKKQTWRLLFNALYEPDILRFSVSTLTATALSKAVISVLTRRYHYKSDWNLTFNFSRIEKDGNFIVPQQFHDQARDNAVGVIADIEAVLAVCDIEMKGCSRWFEARFGPEIMV